MRNEKTKKKRKRNEKKTTEIFIIRNKDVDEGMRDIHK